MKPGFQNDDLRHRAAEAVKEPKPKRRRSFKPKNRRQGTLDGGILQIPDNQKMHSRSPLYKTEINRFPPAAAPHNATSFPTGNPPENHVDNDDPDGSILLELEQRNSTLKAQISAMEKRLADLLHRLDQVERRHNYCVLGIEGAHEDVCLEESIGDVDG